MLGDYITVSPKDFLFFFWPEYFHQKRIVSNLSNDQEIIWMRKLHEFIYNQIYWRLIKNHQIKPTPNVSTMAVKKWVLQKWLGRSLIFHTNSQPFLFQTKKFLRDVCARLKTFRQFSHFFRTQFLTAPVSTIDLKFVVAIAITILPFLAMKYKWENKTKKNIEKAHVPSIHWSCLEWANKNIYNCFGFFEIYSNFYSSKHGITYEKIYIFRIKPLQRSHPFGIGMNLYF